VPETEPQIPLREGLPSTYRMRADAHYVDLMETRATQSVRATAPPTQARDVVREPESDNPTLHAGRDLAQAIATLSSCAALLSDAPSELSRAVVGDLIMAEAWRASSLLHATRVVRGELSVTWSVLSASTLLDKVVRGFQPERRVRAMSIEVRSALPEGTVIVGDEQLVTGAVSGAVLSSLALLTGIEAPRLTVSLGHDSTAGVTFSVSQASVTPPAHWQVRAFDAGWTDRPGGVPALLWMLALRDTARAHGGTARVERADRGTTIGFSLPLGV
jgi:hypothetical protein